MSVDALSRGDKISNVPINTEQITTSNKIKVANCS